MAADAVALLDYLDWKKERDLNIIGVSLGGMISQGEFIFFRSLAKLH